MSIDLTTQIGKLELRNPVMTASGTFGYGDEIAEMFDYRRIGGLVTKSISMEPIEGNSPPRIVETAAGMLNAIGWANPGVDGFIHDKLPHIKNYPTKLIVSIAGNQISDFVNVVKRLDNEDGIDVLNSNNNSLSENKIEKNLIGTFK